MSYITKATPIDAFLDQQQSAQHPRAPKLCVLRGTASWESPEVNWMADQVIRACKGMSRQTLLSDLTVSEYRLLPGASNDPNDVRFAPEDQLPVFFDPIGQGQALLLVTTSSTGLPDSTSTRLVERLLQFKKSDGGRRLFAKTKRLGIVGYGNATILQACWALAGAWARLGIDVAAGSIVALDKQRGEPKDADIGGELVSLAHSLWPAIGGGHAEY